MFAAIFGSSKKQKKEKKVESSIGSSSGGGEAALKSILGLPSTDENIPTTTVKKEIKKEKKKKDAEATNALKSFLSLKGPDKSNNKETNDDSTMIPVRGYFAASALFSAPDASEIPPPDFGEGSSD